MPQAVGEGRTGVMLVGEALTEKEAARGEPMTGPAGFLLGQAFQRGGWERDDFWIDTCLRCRPPGNKLKGEPYEAAVLAGCASHLDASIAVLAPRAIVALGATAMQRLLGLPLDTPLTGRPGRRGYAEWSPRYDAWILSTYHPSFIQRGNYELLLALLSDLQHACEWAAGGLKPVEPTLEVDPPIGWFQGWVGDYLLALRNNPQLPLTVDIETPTKGKLEDEGWDDPTYQILRVGLHWRGLEGVSVPFCMPYIPVLADLLATESPKRLWNALYDSPRLHASGCPLNGPIWDSMWMWHMLESDQDKALHHATPFLRPDIPRWKHEASAHPGRYSALDGVYEALVCEKAEGLLRQRRLWDTYERHIRQVDAGPCAWMSSQGLLLDQGKRLEASLASATRLDTWTAQMQACVPQGVRPRQVYKLHPPEPQEGETWITIQEEAPAKVCQRCGLAGVLKPHVIKKRDNPCWGAEIVVEPRMVERQVRVDPFTPSGVQLKAYALAKGHKLVTTGKKVSGYTFDDAALVTLRNRYPTDPLYQVVQSYREEQKLLTGYLGQPGDGGKWEGGLTVGPDGRVHTVLTHNPSTLRFSSVNPNLQNCPRVDDEPSVYDVVRDLFVADPGCLLVECDFRAIEAVLVGYFARSPAYIRLAKLGVHDFLLAHVAGHPELVDVGWPDDRLGPALKAIKHQFNGLRAAVKTIIHGGNYLRGAFDISRQQRSLFPSPKDAQRLLDTYFAVCPEIPVWQRATIEEAHRQGFLTNPFGYQHRFWMTKTFERQGREWVAVSL